MLVRSRYRPGISLTEVLVALFVVAVGLIALLTLFPVGALQMAQAIRDDRCGHVGGSAAAQVRKLWKTMAADYAVIQAYPLPATVTDPTTTPDIRGQFLDATYRPGGVYDGVTPAGSTLPQAIDTDIGYPVYLDPMGWMGYAGSPNVQTWLYGTPNSIPRRGLPVWDEFDGKLKTQLSADPNTPPDATWFSAPLRRQAATLRLVSLLDDITFTKAGRADLSAIDVQREGRFTWAAMIKPLRVSQRTEVQLAVVVYEGRSLTNLGDEQGYAATFSFGSNVVTLTYTGAKPKVKRGSWILDATMDAAKHTGNAHFYRVVDIDDSTPGMLRLEIQTQARDNGNTAVILEGVREVFLKHTLDPTSFPRYN